MEFVKIFTGYLHRKMLCFVSGNTGQALCRAAIEGRRHISALQTESTFFTSEICAKKALHKMQKVCYNDIMHSLCISNRFPKRFHASFQQFYYSQKEGSAHAKSGTHHWYMSFPRTGRIQTAMYQSIQSTCFCKRIPPFYIQCKIRLFSAADPDRLRRDDCIPADPL